MTKLVWANIVLHHQQYLEDHGMQDEEEIELPAPSYRPREIFEGRNN